ncbi:MAG: hypothetical protein Harvfovirus68_8 [Harvfovirus sp.]|uniref:Uncharacterized protein n=1 Tax=Harvfovirus sp. TaxID=2487768 RepID=A0A3G5A3R2_9VIRU|nr:MAG: hypothetical protein Harvfovirus68_8 [Harvfovirus sp.]
MGAMGNQGSVTKKKLAVKNMEKSFDAEAKDTLSFKKLAVPDELPLPSLGEIEKILATADEETAEKLCANYFEFSSLGYYTLAKYHEEKKNFVEAFKYYVNGFNMKSPLKNIKCAKQIAFMFQEGFIAMSTEPDRDQQIKHAIAWYEKYLAAGGVDLDVYINIAQLYLEQLKITEDPYNHLKVKAADNLKKYLAVKADFKYMKELAKLHRDSAKYVVITKEIEIRSAIELFKDCLTVEDDIDCYYEIGNLYLQLEDGLAIYWFDRYLGAVEDKKISFDAGDEVVVKICETYIKASRYESVAAVEWFKLAVKRDLPHARYMLAYSMRKSDAKKAEQLCLIAEREYRDLKNFPAVKKCQIFLTDLICQ